MKTHLSFQVYNYWTLTLALGYKMVSDMLVLIYVQIL